MSIDVINYFRENTKNHTKYQQQQQKSILSQIILIATENVIARGQGHSYMNMSPNN